MKTDSSRRNFLAAGLSLPVAGMASAAAPQAPPKKAAAPKVAEVAASARYRTLGKTGLKVSTVGYGCMITSDSSVISRAVDMGITYFDTARGYQSGNNERMVGAALKGSRNKIVLSSKSESKTAAEAMGHLETSLKELGTDYLDIWYMHSRDTVVAIPDEQIAVWENAKKQGKIRHIGISTHNPAAIVERVLAVGKFEVMLSTYNFTVGTGNDPAYKKLVDAGIGMVAMKVMAPASRAGGFSNLPGFRADRMDRVTKPGGPVAALKWVLRDTRFATTIPSMTDVDQLEANFRAMSEPFSAADEKLLAQINEDVRPLYCRMCHQCSGQCPKGVPVADTIRYLSYADFYGQFALGREHFLALPEEARAVRCRDCGSCEVKCPNGVHVAERLVRAQDLFV
jgi:predicted aldo/keto reductase-like oxidoreductase